MPSFLADASQGSKAFHHRHPRVIWQESSPQNNFRRIIAARLPAGQFCNHTVNYAPAHEADVDLRLILAVLDSQLADWYFRLGSTNAHVSHYQVGVLPFPRISPAALTADWANATAAVPDRLGAGDVPGLVESLADELAEPPFGERVLRVLVSAVERITAIEAKRGDIARRERSRLAEPAQPYQDLIDRLLYRMAGLTDAEAAGLEERLSRML